MPATGTPVEVDIHWTKGELAGQIAYTIHGVVSGLAFGNDQVGVAQRYYRYPDGTTVKTSGLSCYDRRRVRLSRSDTKG